jgi:tRNA threonylcarbamoyladenosine biosynthesis protein TsaB
MKILAIETATEACSVALLAGDEIRQRYEHQPQRQADLVLPMVDALLAEAGLKAAELDAVAFGRGPGSFTGLRIATAVTQGIAVAADLPVVPVSTLAALAQGAFREHGAGQVLVAVDARMSEVYWAAYRAEPAGGGGGLVRLDGAEYVLAPGDVPLPETGRWLGAGSGRRVYGEVLRRRAGECVEQVDDGRWPEAPDALTLGLAGYEAGDARPPEQAEPV